jgi:hypothetical protein
MIGSGVPDQLISNNVVFSPGLIPITGSEAQITASPQIQPDVDYSAPPVPEPITMARQEPVSSFEPEPEFEYEAPPVPEPVSVKSPASSPSFESEFEPEIPIPESKLGIQNGGSTDFEFKTPEEILAAEKSEEVASSIPFERTSISTSEETYKPKAVPFTSKVPTPAPAPKGFQSAQQIPTAQKSELPPTPFITSQKEPQTKSDSLMDYMPEPIYSKKDMKKLEKQKKKEEKEKKIQEEKEKQQHLLEQMKKAKKEKKEKPKKVKKEKQETTPAVPVSPPAPITEPTSAPSLFQTLTQKGDETSQAQASQFVPFSEKKESQIQEESKLRIIPNAADIGSKPSGFRPIQPTTAPIGDSPKSGSKELIICKNCGSILSSDYAFCNKCGSQL